MNDNQRDQLLVDTHGSMQAIKATLAGVVDRLTGLTAWLTRLDRDVDELQQARREDIGRRSGATSAWGLVRWGIAIVISLGSMLLGHWLSYIFRG